MTSTIGHLSAVLAAAFVLMLGLAACDDGQQGASPEQGQAPAGEQQ